MIYVRKTIKDKSKIKHLQSPTHNELEKCLRIKHRIEISEYVDTDEWFNILNTNHNWKCGLHLVKCDFEVVLDEEFHSHFFLWIPIY